MYSKRNITLNELYAIAVKYGLEVYRDSQTIPAANRGRFEKRNLSSSPADYERHQEDRRKQKFDKKFSAAHLVDICFPHVNNIVWCIKALQNVWYVNFIYRVYDECKQLIEKNLDNDVMQDKDPFAAQRTLLQYPTWPDYKFQDAGFAGKYEHNTDDITNIAVRKGQRNMRNLRSENCNGCEHGGRNHFCCMYPDVFEKRIDAELLSSVAVLEVLERCYKKSLNFYECIQLVKACFKDRSWRHAVYLKCE